MDCLYKKGCKHSHKKLWSYTFNSFTFKTRFILTAPVFRFCFKVYDGCLLLHIFFGRIYKVISKLSEKVSNSSLDWLWDL